MRQHHDDNTVQEITGAEADITWTVHLVNKKAAPLAAATPSRPLISRSIRRRARTELAAARAALAILDGDTDALAAYDDDRNRECTTYLHERASYYAIEQRWPASPFWSRRAGALRALGFASRSS
jgi:hypothetical protein